jgi:Icc-related predicted phosphoesterase
VLVVCLSDTHLRETYVPHGDVLIHAGDVTCNGTLEELHLFNCWLGTLPHAWKIVIAGNHDRVFQTERVLAERILSNAHYIQDALIEVGGLRIWGTPWQPEYRNGAFNLPRGLVLRRALEGMPENLDILVSHAPPFSILDRTWDGLHIGCQDLLELVGSRAPRLHVFGHVHEARGERKQGSVLHLNVSVCGNKQPPRPAVLVSIESSSQGARPVSIVSGL